jgi:3-oxoacyl-[acyl-carrier protein] reductase
MKTENWHKVVEINVDAPQRITAELLDQKLVRTGGTILGVSSIAGIAGNNGQTNYAASKAGVIGWVQELAPRIAADGLTINAVAPGFIETDMTADVPDAIKESVPARRAGTPDEVAACVRFLASDAAGYVTGTTLYVDGGLAA